MRMLLIITAQLASLTPVEIGRIGAIDAPREAVFGHVADLGLSSDHRVYVLDSQASTVRVFLPDGTFERRFGGPGAGPGEFSRPSSLVVTSERVSVFEGSGRVASFTPEGDHISTRQLALGIRGGAWLGDGRYLVVRSGSASLSRVDATEHLLVLAGDRTDTIASFASSDILVRNAQGSAAIRSVFCPLLHYAGVADSLVYVADGTTGVLRKGRHGAGSPTWLAERKVARPGRVLSDADWVRLLDRVPARLNARKEDLVVAPVVSGVCGVELGGDGRVWVRLDTDGGPEQWRGLTATGLEPDATLVAPEGVSLRAFGDGVAAGVWRDPFDVQYVLLFELR